MGSGACEDLSRSRFEKFDSVKVSVVETHKDVVEAPDDTNSLGPITPDSDRENGDFPVDRNSPPMSAKKMTSVACLDLETDRNGENPLCCEDSSSPQTPKDGVFDPFAPGPDDLVLAPQCRKFVNKSRNLVARRLSFESSIEVLEEESHGKDAFFISDEEIIEAVYENLLETIVSHQREVLVAGTSSLEWDSKDCRTPPLAPRLHEIADTCPGAPMRPAGKSRKIDLALCRRLQFSP